MSELVDFYQDELTQPISSWDRRAPLWDASDVLANTTLRTAAQKLTVPQVTIVEYHSPFEPIQQVPFELIRAAIRKAFDLVRLPNGWNSYNARPVSEEAARHAITFLVQAASAIPNIAAPAVVPTVRGGLQLEWHRQGIDFEVEFGPGGPASWCAEDRTTGKTLEEPIVGHEDAVREWLNRVSG